MPDYKQKIIDLLNENLTEKGFKLWSGINSLLPNVWEYPTSSTGKHHRKLNGQVPSQSEHVYQMLYAAKKVIRLFGYNLKTTESDKIFFAIVLHDSLKYGDLGTRKHTDAKHDKEAGDMVASNKKTFTKVFTEEQFYVVEEAVRFHSGRWSTDAPKDGTFDFKNCNPETLFIHILDMMSTADLIQTDVRE